MSSKENNSEVAVDKATENDKAGGDAKSEVKGTKRPAESKSEDVKKQKKEENGEEDEDVEDEEDVEGEEEDEEEELPEGDEDLDEGEVNTEMEPLIRRIFGSIFGAKLRSLVNPDPKVIQEEEDDGEGEGEGDDDEDDA
uniref:Uncharacterized protein n=1 Tax=Timema bartmani TaxID=61472 RepID=A0A7R9I3T3_9NEOP|nr:unnamed protein product [Timema bartmani]